MPWRPAKSILNREENFLAPHDRLKMKETPMQKSEKSLLPLRRKISPPTILNCEYHATEQRDGDKEITNSVPGRRERLFSASSRSISSSKHDSSLSERCLTPPFTPPGNYYEIKESGTQSFHLRRPSEHFLEVLHKHDQTLPKVPSATSLPPLRKPNQREDSSKRTPGETKIAFNGSVHDEAFSRECCETQLLLVSGAKKGFVTPIHTNGRILRKTNSLPLIKTCSALTNGLCDINVSSFENRTKSAVRRENTLNGTEHACKPFDENLEETNNESEVFDDDEEEQDLEKFGMICHWLQECEKAKVT